MAAPPDDPDRLKCTLYVGGLDPGVTKSILRTAFAPFGPLKTVEIPVDRATEKHRGFGFVRFEESEDAAEAIANMHQSELLGRILTVNLSRSGPRRPGESSRAIWDNESFLGKQTEEGGADLVDDNNGA